MSTDVDNDDLQATQAKRWEMLAQVLANQLDPKVASAATRIVDGIDKQILTRQRIQVETKTGESNEALARAIIQSMRKESRGADLARAEKPLDALPFTLPDDPSPGTVIAEGAGSVGVCTERFDDFQERMEKGNSYTGTEMDNTPKSD